MWLFDSRLLSDPFCDADWEALTQLAGQRGIAGLCLDGLRQSRDRLGGRLPEPVEATLASIWLRPEPSRVYLQGTVHKRDVLVSDLSALGDWGLAYDSCVSMHFLLRHSSDSDTASITRGPCLPCISTG